MLKSFSWVRGNRTNCLKRIARIRHFAAPYARSGSLSESLRASAALWFDDGIVIDPDSRLTQLGLLTVSDPGRYFFFESRSYGSDTNHRLPDLASRWAREIFGVENARAFVAPLPVSGTASEVTVSLGVGDNMSKRLDDNFERDLISMVRGRSVLIDKGGTAEERARVDQVLFPGMRTHDGTFAPFAAEIARSNLYMGYDSAGGHVASAGGVPQICIFAGAVSERFFHRWKPRGEVIRGDQGDVLDQVRRLL